MADIRTRLEDGIFYGCYTNGIYKVDITNVSFVYPLTEENACLASLLSRVLTRANEKYPTQRALNRALDALYDTELSSRTAKDNDRIICTFTVSSLCDRFSRDGTEIRSRALDILGGIIFDPLLENGVFRTDYVEGEKKQLIDEIRAQKNSRSSYAISRCIANMCEGEYASIPSLGTEDGVAKIGAKELFGFYTELLEKAEIFIFSVTADADKDGERFARTLAKRLGAREFREHLPAPTVEAKGVRYVTETERITQGNLCIGYRTDMRFSDPDYHVFLLFTELFANSPTSKLFVNVRERLSLCYYCSANAIAQSGVLLVSSGIDAKNAKLTEDEIEKQLDMIRAGEFTDRELDDAKRFLISYLRSRKDSPRSMMSWYYTRSMYGTSDSPEEYSILIENTTADEVIKAANSLAKDTVYLMKGGDENEE